MGGIGGRFASGAVTSSSLEEEVDHLFQADFTCWGRGNVWGHPTAWQLFLHLTATKDELSKPVQPSIADEKWS